MSTIARAGSVRLPGNGEGAGLPGGGPVGLPRVARAWGLAIAFAAVLGGSGEAQVAGETIVAATLRHWPPQYALDEAGRPVGFAIDVMDEVAQQAGLGVEYRVYETFEVAIAALERGEVDVIPNLGDLAERRGSALFTRPVETFTVDLFARSGDTVAGLDDLAGSRVAAVRSNAAVELLRQRPEILLEIYPDAERALFDLLAGQVEALALPGPYVDRLLRDASLDTRVRRVGQPLLEVKRAIAVSRSRPDLLRRLDEAVEVVVASPRYREIYTRWYADPQPYWSISRAVMATAIVLGAALLAMGWWRYRSVLSLNRQLGRTIAQRERAELALRQREEQLAQARKFEAIGRLSGGVAHDFNNVLTAILGYSELLQAQLAPGDPKRRDVEEIRSAAQRAADITRQLLAFGRRQVLSPVLLDVNGVVLGMENMLRRLVGEQVELRLEVEPSLWPVLADSAQVGQVILNLVLNARDAMPRGGHIVVRTRNATLGPEFVAAHLGSQSGPHAALEVADDGGGIGPEAMAHLFEPFFTTKDQGKGTGLGLATVYGIVKQSGGYVDVVNRPGEGATFAVYLPRAEGMVAASARATQATAPQRGTALVVEDEPALRALTTKVLAANGLLVLAAESGDAALDLLANGAGGIDLLVTDLRMPGMGGRELADRVAERFPGLRILFVSGYADEAPVRHAAERFLPKPFSSSELLAAVDELLREAPGSSRTPSEV
jgi:signal transduction histidine kinase/CheY-like chemotaxis protein